jgi:2-hydroxy-3-oxopropionate reductase
VKAVGVIGLGVMGGPMAANLAKAGYDVVGFSRRGRTPDGGRAGSDVADVARQCEVIITVLPDGPDVSAVLLGNDGVIGHARAGATIIDMSTIDPATARRVGAAAVAAGLGFLDAPVSGGEQGAIDGTLSIMVGGDPPVLARVEPVLSAVGTTIVHVGGTGAGQIVKAANQLLVGGTLGLVAEALVFLDAHDVDKTAAVEVLSGGLAGSRVLERKGRSMLDHQFRPGFRVDLHHKDLGILLAAAREAGVSLPLGALTAQLFVALRAQGGGSLDHSALVTVIEGLSGRVAE